MIGLELLFDGSASDRNFKKLMQVVLDTGDVSASVRWGMTTFTFTASTTSAGINQPHGLGKVPSLVIMGGWWVSSGTRLGTAHVYEDPAAWDDTQFPCVATVQGAAYTGTATAAWVAIG